MPSNILVGFAAEISFAKISRHNKDKQKFSPFLEYNVIIVCSSPANDSFDTHSTPYMRSIELSLSEKWHRDR